MLVAACLRPGQLSFAYFFLFGSESSFSGEKVSQKRKLVSLLKNEYTHDVSKMYKNV